MSVRTFSVVHFLFPEKCEERVAGHECEKSAKRKSDETKVQYAAYVQTAVSVVDVASVCHLADYFQVHTPLGLDDGISGCETEEPVEAYLGETFCGG